MDDWAFKKGHTYGTIIVDLEQHSIVDLLPDREAQTVENWFKDRPEVTLVTRDRFSQYATGVTQGVPHALQVADRWHLLKNMGDALQKLLERKRQELIAAPASALQEAAPQQEIIQSNAVPELSPRHERMHQIKQMQAEGSTIRAIARTLKMSRNTVRKYLDLQEPPQKKGTTTTNLAHYNEYLQSRMLEDSQVEVLQLFKEIKQMGYNGGRTTLYEYLNSYGKRRGNHKLLPLPKVSWTASQVKVLLCKKEEQLLEKDKALVQDICEKSNDIKEARILAIRFRDMMESKQGHLLKDWINEVVQSTMRELKSFAKGLLRDYKAVENALTLPWSNGQVEGQVNKLKTIKRQMYGRASFELLRKRVILSSTLYHQK